MIVNKRTKSIIDGQGVNVSGYLESGDWVLVPKNLAATVKSLFPNFDLVVDEEGLLVDVVSDGGTVPITPPEPPVDYTAVVEGLIEEMGL
jgi:hypothetical protein